MAAEIELIVVRHAKAGLRDPVKYPDDADRKLTDDGRKQMRKAALGLGNILDGADVIVTSPYARAAETAEILAPVLTPKRAVETCKELEPGGSTKALLAFLEKLPQARRIVLVGHEPDLSTLVGELIGAEDTDGLVFKKGGCCRILFEHGLDTGTGQLIWWLTPAILRDLA